MPRRTGNRQPATKFIRVSQRVYDILTKNTGPGRTYDDVLREALEDAGFAQFPEEKDSPPPGEE